MKRRKGVPCRFVSFDSRGADGVAIAKGVVLVVIVFGVRFARAVGPP